MYADDTLLSMSRLEISVPRILSIIDFYDKLSEFKINWDKSEILLPTKTCFPAHFSEWSFKRVPENFKYLGILLQGDLNIIMPTNLDSLLTKLRVDIAQWAPLNVMLRGKIKTINMNFATRLLYILKSIKFRVPHIY